MTATIRTTTNTTAARTTRAEARVPRRDGARRCVAVSSRPVRPARRRHPEAVYRRRRMVVGVVTAALVAITIVLAIDVLAGSSGVPASAVSGQPAPGRSVTIARPGDSLWSLAETYRGDVSVTAYVEALISLNDGPTIEAGQRIVLP